MTLRVAAEQFLTVEQVRASDNCGCVTVNDPSDEIIEAAIDHGSDLIAIMTDGRVMGRRTLKARPCRTGDECGCTCCGLDAVPLGGGYHVEVTSVKINGVTISSALYEIHDSLVGPVLVRINPGGDRPDNWPSTQDRWRNDTEDRTFSITFTEGIFVDNETIYEAALEAVCDILSSGTIKTNEIGNGVISAQLGGTTVTIDPDRLERARNGEIGPAFTKMLGIYAPYGRQPSFVFSPELMSGWDLNLRVVV